MTREEAIYWIKNLAVLSTEKDMASITEALNMRQAAIDAIEPTLKSILQGNSFKAVNVMDKIRDLPSAQPFTAEQIQTMQELESAQVKKAYELGKADRPKGYWIDTQVDSVGIAHRCICSICGEEPAAWSSINKFDFCPNCGADMRERGEG